MTIVEKQKASLRTKAKDAEYVADFAKVYHRYRSWELDPMDDQVGVRVMRDTGKITVKFYPVETSMVFPEDAKRKCEYTLAIEKARELYRIIRDGAQFWFALDMADYLSK